MILDLSIIFVESGESFPCSIFEIILFSFFDVIFFIGSTTLEYPASYPHVISVGAVDEDEDYAIFSNYNYQVELVGPGVSILSTLPDDKYGSLSGTSMATPHVAGAAALVWSYFPECSNHQIRNILALTAKDVGSSGCDDKTGFGLVQAKAAYDILDKHGCEAGGVDISPVSNGVIGGCYQPLPNESSTSPSKVPTNRPTAHPTERPTYKPTEMVRKHFLYHI